MLKKVQSYLQFGNLFCGVEHTTKNGKAYIIGTLLKKAKEEVTIVDSFEGYTAEGLISKLPKKQHLHLIINDDNVLTKLIESEVLDSLKLVYKAFPNINLDDFYYEVIQQKNSHFVSICRKEYVDSLTNTYTKNNRSVINYSLGHSIVTNIIAFFNNEDTLYTSNALITIQENILSSIEKTEFENLKNYEVNGLTVSNNQLLSFSGALHSVIKSNNALTNYENRKQFLLNKYNHARFFRQFLKFAGVFLLGLLLINFLFFNYYFNEVNTLNQASQINLSTKSKIVDLNKSVSDTQKIVDDMLQSGASKSSYYANSIVQSLPISIILSELNYQPLLKRLKEDKTIELQSHTIIVSGDSNSSEAYSKWISLLEANIWVKTIETIAYSDVSNSKSVFTFQITIANDW